MKNNEFDLRIDKGELCIDNKPTGLVFSDNGLTLETRKEVLSVSDMQKEIDNAIKALKKMGEKESQRAEFLDAAKDLRMLYQSFIDAGFSSSEAWMLLNNLLSIASKK